MIDLDLRYKLVARAARATARLSDRDPSSVWFLAFWVLVLVIVMLQITKEGVSASWKNNLNRKRYVNNLQKKSARFNRQIKLKYSVLQKKAVKEKCSPLFIVGNAPKLGTKAKKLTEI